MDTRDQQGSVKQVGINSDVPTSPSPVDAASTHHFPVASKFLSLWQGQTHGLGVLSGIMASTGAPLDLLGISWLILWPLLHLMSTIYPPSELEIQAIHREGDQHRSSNQRSDQTPKDILSQSLYSSYRGIDRSRPPLPGSERRVRCVLLERFCR